MKTIVTTGLIAAAAIAGVALLGLARAPQAVAAQGDQCVDANALQSRMVIGGNKLFIQDSWGHAAVLTLSQPCSQMDDMDRIGFEFNGDTHICKPHDVQILYSKLDERPAHCIITDVQPLTANEAKAYTSSSSSGR